MPQAPATLPKQFARALHKTADLLQSKKLNRLRKTLLLCSVQRIPGLQTEGKRKAKPTQEPARPGRVASRGRLLPPQERSRLGTRRRRRRRGHAVTGPLGRRDGAPLGTGRAAPAPTGSPAPSSASAQSPPPPPRSLLRARRSPPQPLRPHRRRVPVRPALRQTARCSRSPAARSPGSRRRSRGEGGLPAAGRTSRRGRGC